MKTNDTGEFELVLGNKQVLSGFFIVVILFGVFFTMGYIVGRNSAPSPKMAAEATAAQPAPASAAPAPTPPARPESAPPGAEAVKPAETSAVQSAEAPASGGQTPPAPQTKAAEAPPAPASAADASGGAAVVAEPEPGQTYLQVMAVKRPEAEAVVRTLKDKGFPAVLAPAPDKKELFRVLVGPYSDAAATGKAKAELENAGFHPLVRR